MRARLLACVFLLGPAGPALAAEGPAEVVGRLYQAYLDVRPEGLPTPAQMERFTPLLSPRLVRLIEEARRYQADYARRNPDDKPPFVEGCLFASLFEGPTAFEVERVEAQAGGSQLVRVKLSYVDAQQPKQPPLRWTDAVFVRQERGRFLVDDVEFRGQWAFKPSGKLSELLASRD